MNYRSTVDNTLNEILLVLKPSVEDWETRLRILNELQGAVEFVEGLRGEHGSKFCLDIHLMFIVLHLFLFMPLHDLHLFNLI